MDNFKVFRFVFFITIGFFSTSAFSFNYDPPSWCVDGKSWDLKIEGPDYVAVGIDRRFKGDLPYSWGVKGRVLEFYNSYESFVGNDDSNSEGNAYLNMNFPAAARGSQLVWVRETTGKYSNGWDRNSCSKKQIIVQSMPTIAKGFLSDGDGLEITGEVVSVTIDQAFSKIAVEGNGQPKISYRFFSLDGLGTQSIDNAGTTFSFTPQYNGEYRVTAYVSDGEYSASVFLGNAYFTGGSYCRTCGPAQ
jgi:hypothetical protein